MKLTKRKNIGINAILNVIKQSLSVVFPLITYPYALRVLGAESIGKVTYAQSIISYFSLIAMLGISSYAVREGAKRRENKEDFSCFANEIFTLNILFTLAAYVLLVICIIFVRKMQDYTLLLLLLSISIALTTLGVDWINTVFEDFLFITIRSIITHVASLIILFVFVHSSEDYYAYAMMAISSNGIICISNWFYCRRYAKVRLTIYFNAKAHIKPLLILFANAVAVSIYTNFDTTMLGWFKGDYYVGLYAVPVKIYMIIKNLLIAVYAVSIPRLAYYIGNQKKEEFKKLYSEMWGYLSALLIPAAVGLICVSSEVIYFMGGDEFSDSVFSLQLLSVALVFAIFGGLTTACLNITIGREKDNLIATFISAGLNFGLNFVFIPLFSHNGAAFTTLLSEAFVFLFCFFRVPNKRKYMDYRRIGKNFISVTVGSGAIIVFSILISVLVSDIFTRLFITILCSVAVYVLILYLLKNEFLMDVKIKLLERIGRK